VGISNLILPPKHQANARIRKAGTGTELGRGFSVETSSNQDTEEITVTDWDQVEDWDCAAVPSRVKPPVNAILKPSSQPTRHTFSFLENYGKSQAHHLFDAPPNPTVMVLHLACHPISHAKVLVKIW
jgi:hypothetical protein